MNKYTITRDGSKAIIELYFTVDTEKVAAVFNINESLIQETNYGLRFDIENKTDENIVKLINKLNKTKSNIFKRIYLYILLNIKIKKIDKLLSLDVKKDSFKKMNLEMKSTHLNEVLNIFSVKREIFLKHTRYKEIFENNEDYILDLKNKYIINDNDIELIKKVYKKEEELPLSNLNKYKNFEKYIDGDLIIKIDIILKNSIYDLNFNEIFERVKQNEENGVENTIYSIFNK